MRLTTQLPCPTQFDTSNRRRRTLSVYFERYVLPRCSLRSLWHERISRRVDQVNHRTMYTSIIFCGCNFLSSRMSDIKDRRVQALRFPFANQCVLTSMRTKSSDPCARLNNVTSRNIESTFTGSSSFWMFWCIGSTRTQSHLRSPSRVCHLESGSNAL